MNAPFYGDEWVPPQELEGSPYAARRMFFNQNAASRNGFFVCPACGYPTVHLPQRYEQCFLCHWNDDMQDDPYAHINEGGPNDSSLAVARKNFNETMCVWSWSERDDFSDYMYFRIFSAEILEYKKELIALYDSLLSARSCHAMDVIWQKINHQLNREPANPYSAAS